MMELKLYNLKRQLLLALVRGEDVASLQHQYLTLRREMADDPHRSNLSDYVDGHTGLVSQCIERLAPGTLQLGDVHTLYRALMESQDYTQAGHVLPYLDRSMLEQALGELSDVSCIHLTKDASDWIKAYKCDHPIPAPRQALEKWSKQLARVPSFIGAKVIDRPFERGATLKMLYLFGDDNDTHRYTEILEQAVRALNWSVKMKECSVTGEFVSISYAFRDETLPTLACNECQYVPLDLLNSSRGVCIYHYDDHNGCDGVYETTRIGHWYHYENEQESVSCRRYGDRIQVLCDERGYTYFLSVEAAKARFGTSLGRAYNVVF